MSRGSARWVSPLLRGGGITAWAAAFFLRFSFLSFLLFFRLDFGEETGVFGRIAGFTFLDLFFFTCGLAGWLNGLQFQRGPSFL